MAKVLILTPVKNAVHYLEDYFSRLDGLTYDKQKLSVGLLEGDSKDDTYDELLRLQDAYSNCFRRLKVFKRDYGFAIPDQLQRWESSFQLARRIVLAKSRNQLLFRMLADEDWVLWLDVDVIGFQADIVEHLLSYDLEILHPDCVREPGGQSFDLNAWKAHGRQHMHDLRGTGKPVRIDSVGGTMLLVRADLHRDGLIFPPFKYGVESPVIRPQHSVWGKGEIETEGLAAMAHDMGYQCWGLPDLQIVHA